MVYAVINTITCINTHGYCVAGLFSLYPFVFILVKLAIIRCNERLKTTTEKYEKTSAELDEKVREL